MSSRACMARSLGLRAVHNQMRRFRSDCRASALENDGKKPARVYGVLRASGSVTADCLPKQTREAASCLQGVPAGDPQISASFA